MVNGFARFGSTTTHRFHAAVTLFHPRKENLVSSVRSGNCRSIFQLEERDEAGVDFLDWHGEA